MSLKQDVFDDLAPSRLKLVIDFIKYMRCVDRNDMRCVDRNGALMRIYTTVREPFKWNVNVAFHFIKEVVLNSAILFDKVNPRKLRLQNEHYR